VIGVERDNRAHAAAATPATTSYVGRSRPIRNGIGHAGLLEAP
jgi:hypothetical protein